MINHWRFQMLFVIYIILFNSLHCYGSKRHRTSPQIVAQRTGASRFEEYFDDDENASRESNLRKQRFLSDPDIDPTLDVDPEVYQGVLGRPGIDFPVMTTIPKTQFDCASLGNGYFADLETSCQVFHICDEGRKMSFLCPNGTIFRQIDLICDWWFKVDCNSAPEHYAESSEQLQRAQKLRQSKLRHVVRSEQGFGTSGEIFFIRNDARPAESAAVHIHHQGRAFQPANSKINKRMDNNVNEANKSGEILSASEILYSRNGRNSKSTSTSSSSSRSKTSRAVSNVDDELSRPHEIQETAESSSFVKDRSTYSGYSYPTPDKGYDYPSPSVKSGYSYLPPSQGYNYDSPRDGKKLQDARPEKFSTNPRIVLADPQPFATRPTEKAPTASIATTTTIANFAVVSSTKSTVTEAPPASKSTQRGSTTYLSSLMAEKEKQSSAPIALLNRIQADTSKEFKTTTPSYETKRVNTYSTARRPSGKTKETPFYTPTIPTIRTSEPAVTTATPSTTRFVETTTPTVDTSTKPTHSEVVKHALEMMESLKELEVADNIEGTEVYMGQRSGLEVPPSSDPSTLHSLALYFANGDNNNTKRGIARQNISTVLLSEKTVTKYEELFPNDRRSTTESFDKLRETTQATTIKLDEDESSNDLDTQNSRNPILSAAGTPQLREIAQVFTHALSAYLQDPEQFRKILSEIRPTTPPPIVETNEIPRFPGVDNEFVRQESAYNIPRATATTSKPDDEIFDYSDVTIQPKTTTESDDESTTTDASLIITTTYPETLPPASSNLADRTPASRLVSENLEKNARGSFRGSKDIDETFEFNTSADEINKGIDEGSNYFPDKTGSKSVLSPYGFGVKPANSTPIYVAELVQSDQLPSRWGEDPTTVEPLTEQYPTVNSDLLPPYDINGSEVHVAPNNDLQAPFNEDKDESLHSAQSQSFVASRNNLYGSSKKSKTYNLYNVEESRFAKETTTDLPETTSIKGHFITKEAIQSTTTQEPEILTTDYPTTTLSPSSGETTQPPVNDEKPPAVFLDPLSINDGLMQSAEETTLTPSPNIYLPDEDQHASVEDANSSNNNDEKSSTTFATTQRRGKSSFATTPLTIRFAGEESNNNDIEPMQKRANEMFGNLNETQVNHLMNVMKKADENKTVKRLILLLIQTCDGDDHNKTLEDSRNALLNALIGMDNADDQQNQLRIVKTRREKSLRTTSTTEIPITTYKSPQHVKYTSSETVEDQDVTTTFFTTPTTTTSTTSTTLPPPRLGRQQAEQEDAAVVREQNKDEYSARVEVLKVTKKASLNFEKAAAAQAVTTTTTTTTSTTTSTTEKPTTATADDNLLFAANSRGKVSEQFPKFKLKSNLKTNTGVRYQKSLGTNTDSLSESGSQQNGDLDHKNADTRALELLRSLYSLASRWGRK